MPINYLGGLSYMSTHMEIVGLEINWSIGGKRYFVGS